MPFPPLRVLVPLALGFDGDPATAEHLVDAACDLADADATLHLVFVHMSSTPMVFDGGLAPASYLQSLADIDESERRHASLQLVGLGQLVQRRGRHVSIEVLAPLDGVGETIVAAATRHGVDLIVLCSHNRRGLKRLFLGSVAERVAHIAPISVLIFRDAPAP